ncbi:MAG TPA: hypothetical protein VJU81_14760 [Methylomirabilota bacterium]|nr:hypothetical protein [Methylomirabilota bacterium]
MRATPLLPLLLSLALLAGVLTRPVAGQPAVQQPSADADVAAGFGNVFYVPGKALTCAGSAVLWIAIMGITLGALYEDATHIAAGGCGGKWMLHGRDVEPVLQSAAP